MPSLQKIISQLTAGLGSVKSSIWISITLAIIDTGKDAHCKWVRIRVTRERKGVKRLPIERGDLISIPKLQSPSLYSLFTRSNRYSSMIWWVQHWFGELSLGYPFFDRDSNSLSLHTELLSLQHKECCNLRGQQQASVGWERYHNLYMNNWISSFALHFGGVWSLFSFSPSGSVWQENHTTQTPPFAHRTFAFTAWISIFYASQVVSSIITDFNATRGSVGRVADFLNLW